MRLVLTARRGALLLTTLLAAPALAAMDAGAVALAPGIVVDVEHDVAYASGPDGRTLAIALDDGGTRWTSAGRALPLALQDGRLLALGDTSEPGLALLLAIDPASGNAVDQLTFDLPESVSASFEPGPGRSFDVQVSALANGVRLHWRQQTVPVGGALVIDPVNGPEQPRVIEGSVDISVDAEAVQARPLPQTASRPETPSPLLTAAERLPEVSGDQFRAADDASVLASVIINDATLGAANRWTFYDRPSGAKLGSLDAPYALAPFLVQGSRLLYRLPPHAYLSPAGAEIDLPTRLIGYDLATSRELWSVPVMDFVYRGPLPP